MKQAVLVLLLALGTSGCAQAFDIAPHRALYALTLDSAKPSSGIVGATGTLGYEWGETCDGWTNEQRYKLALDYDEDQPAEVGSSLVTWESKDGLSYRFDERKTRNGQSDEEIHGNATLQSAGGPGKAVIDKPKQTTLDLAPGTIFPTAHTLALIHKGEIGQEFFTAELFDGSTIDSAALVSAVIGPPKPTLEEIASLPKSPLLQRPGYYVNLSFFQDNSKDNTPDYSLSMILLDNGVSESMTIDYGDYVIKATLKKIQALKKPAC